MPRCSTAAAPQAGPGHALTGWLSGMPALVASVCKQKPPSRALTVCAATQLGQQEVQKVWCHAGRAFIHAQEAHHVTRQVGATRRQSVPHKPVGGKVGARRRAAACCCGPTAAAAAAIAAHSRRCCMPARSAFRCPCRSAAAAAAAAQAACHLTHLMGQHFSPAGSGIQQAVGGELALLALQVREREQGRAAMSRGHIPGWEPTPPRQTSAHRLRLLAPPGAAAATATPACRL